MAYKVTRLKNIILKNTKISKSSFPYSLCQFALSTPSKAKSKGTPGTPNTVRSN